MTLTHKDQLLQMPTIFNYYKRSKNKCNQPQTDFQTHTTEIFIALQIGGMVGRDIFHREKKKVVPSISVQLTATSAMGILKHCAIYRSSTSKAL